MRPKFFFNCAPLVYSELADLTDGGELCNPYFGLLPESACEPQMQDTILTNILTEFVITNLEVIHQRPL